MKNILTVKTTVVREVLVESINEDYVLYEDKYTEYLGEEIVSTRRVTGITLKSFTENLGQKEKIRTKIPVPWMYNEVGSVIGISKEVYQNVISGKIHVSEIYDNYEEGIYDPERFEYCLTNHGSYELATLDGTPIPLPKSFNYINGGITDLRFNLDALLKYILAHPEKFIPYYDHDKIEITEIPYYNADDDTGNFQITFNYLLSQEEANILKDLSNFDKYLWIIENTELKNYKKKD